MSTTLYKHVIDGIAPVTMADCIYMGDVDNRTLTENISIDKISEIQKIFPCCLNFKGSLSWTKGVDLTNCKKGDFWLNNSDQNTTHGFHGKIHYPNDIMYYDGVNKEPVAAFIAPGSETIKTFKNSVIGVFIDSHGYAGITNKVGCSSIEYFSSSAILITDSTASFRVFDDS